MTSALIRVATIFILFDGIAVTDPASAMSGEHGRAAGAMVDVVRKSGTSGAGELQPIHVQPSHRPIHQARQRNGNPGGNHNRQRRPETQRTSTRSRAAMTHGQQVSVEQLQRHDRKRSLSKWLLGLATFALRASVPKDSVLLAASAASRGMTAEISQQPSG